MQTREDFGKRIATLREEKNMSQQELAELTGITQSNISRIEQGKYSVGFDILMKIAGAFKMRLDII
jgi:transcriptional regulator with XRE-family HTH domain